MKLVRITLGLAVLVASAPACVAASNDGVEETVANASSAVGEAGLTVTSSTMVDGTTISSDKASSSTTNFSMRCSTGNYVESIHVIRGNWGTYPTVRHLAITCVDPGHTTSEYISIDGAVALAGPSAYTLASCTSSKPLGTGLKGLSDQYVKDLTLQCGSWSHTSASIAARTFPTSLTLTADSSDTTTTAECDGDRVLTGIQGKYRYDSTFGTTAITQLRINCNEVTD